MDAGKDRTGLRRVVPRTWKGRTLAVVLALIAVVAVVPASEHEPETSSTASVNADATPVDATPSEDADAQVARAPAPLTAGTTSSTRPAKKKPAKKSTSTAARPVKKTPASTVTTVTYANCSAVRAAGKAPLRRGQPGYAARLDRDGDGIACVSSGSPGRSASTATPAHIVDGPAGGGAATVSYANCSAARAAGAAPVYRGDPGYGRHLDRDGDGIGCE